MSQWLEIGGELINLDCVARITFNADSHSVVLWAKACDMKSIKCTDNRVAGRLYAQIVEAVEANEERVVSVMLMIRGIEKQIQALEDVAKGGGEL